MGAGDHDVAEGDAQLRLNVAFGKSHRIPAAAGEIQGEQQHRVLAIGKGNAGGIDGIQHTGKDAVLRAGIALQGHFEIRGDICSAEAHLQSDSGGSLLIFTAAGKAQKQAQSQR